MKHDYPELEGTNLKVEGEDGFMCDGVVTGCNYDVGIVIQQKDNPNKYILCLQGPQAPNRRVSFDKTRYDTYFQSIIGSIRQKKLEIGNLVKTVEGFQPHFRLTQDAPTAENCPFSQ